jgi:hypothetical protein
VTSGQADEPIIYAHEAVAGQRLDHGRLELGECLRFRGDESKRMSAALPKRPFERALAPERLVATPA